MENLAVASRSKPELLGNRGFLFWPRSLNIHRLPFRQFIVGIQIILNFMCVHVHSIFAHMQRWEVTRVMWDSAAQRLGSSSGGRKTAEEFPWERRCSGHGCWGAGSDRRVRTRRLCTPGMATESLGFWMETLRILHRWGIALDVTRCELLSVV